jgi:co-chaperonin GroES (HSP10)|tara:strand:+ start:898 stop:1380 length:483 start_codon:yes stop_codon:yes gene_type:complete
MTKLFVPKHVRQEQEKSPTEQPQEISELELKMQEKAAQAESDVVDLPILEKLPQPTGWRVLILPYRGKGKTEGGLFIPDATVDREALTTVCGYVLKVGPLAYQDTTKFGLLQEPWCKENDWVIFGRYAGSRFKIDGGEVRLLNDDEILAKIQNPEDIIHL